MHYKMRKDGNLNDVILILQMKQGDEQAFDKFVRKYYGDILSYCKYYCLDQTEAEDLTQETFLRFMNNIQSYQHIGKAKNYLYVIAGNLCKNHVKKWKADCVEKEVLERKLISDGGIPKQEKQIYVKQALEQMNPELKEIIIMFLYMSTENSVNRSLKTRSLLTKFGTCSIAATGAVTILLLFRSRFHCSAEFHGVCRNRLPYQSDKPCM